MVQTSRPLKKKKKNKKKDTKGETSSPVNHPRHYKNNLLNIQICSKKNPARGDPIASLTRLMELSAHISARRKWFWRKAAYGSSAGLRLHGRPYWTTQLARFLFNASQHSQPAWLFVHVWLSLALQFNRVQTEWAEWDISLSMQVIKKANKQDSARFYC